jgi:hypothetical protein
MPARMQKLFHNSILLTDTSPILSPITLTHKKIGIKKAVNALKTAKKEGLNMPYLLQ